MCDLTLAQWLEIQAEFDGRCTYCLEYPERLEMDHVIPLSRGGNHTADNIVPACRSCNSSKGNKLLSEWAEHLRAIREAKASAA